ncbi:transcriptional regulator [archaeon SCG-AAA382B04]|nr:transcriptional regulator [archaeon SCG-AAA382B04]
MTREDDFSHQKTKKRIAEKIAGEIVLSQNPGETIKKWRENFDITQIELSNQLNMSPSVISDYEGGRRASPGINIIKKIIKGLLKIDEKKGGNKIKNYGKIIEKTGFNFDAILDIKEYKTQINCEEFCNEINANIVGNRELKNTKINGHTAIDSLKAITEFSEGEFEQLYGWSTERALIFTQVTTGKSPMVAIRVTNLKPKLVILHGLNEVSPVAKKIANIENVPLATTKRDIKELLNDLSRIGG